MLQPGFSSPLASLVRFPGREVVLPPLPGLDLEEVERLAGMVEGRRLDGPRFPNDAGPEDGRDDETLLDPELAAVPGHRPAEGEEVRGDEVDRTAQGGRASLD